MKGQLKPDVRARIGDVERDRTLDQLSDHFAAGRLDLDEFEDRSAAALRARTQSELDGILVDLPGHAGRVRPSGRPSRRAAKVVASVVCAGAAVVAMLLGVVDPSVSQGEPACDVQVQDCR